MNYIVVAYDKQRGIGADNDLLWQRDLPADLARFKQLTMGASLIMGRKTFESIGRALPGRENIVVSHSPVAVDGVITATSLDDAFTAATKDRIAVIGGASIYEQSLDRIEVIYATEVQATFPAAQVFIVPFPADFIEVSRVHHDIDRTNKYPFDLVEYRRQG